MGCTVNPCQERVNGFNGLGLACKPIRLGGPPSNHLNRSGLAGGLLVNLLLIALTGHETLLSFSLMKAGMIFCLGLTMSNFGALGMVPRAR